MNPSASGWIKKHLPYFINHMNTNDLDEIEMYELLRINGFIYGSSVKTCSDEESEQLKWTEEEKTKINLFDALAYTYFDTIENGRPIDCIQSIVRFYQKLDQKKDSFTIGLGNSSVYETLEKIIQRRIQTNEPLFKKNFSHLITNALLFVDILAFDHFLLTDEDPFPYAQKLEAILTNTVWLALQEKKEKEKYDELLIKLFESSIHYNTIIKPEAQTIDELQLHGYDHPLERLYILDLSALAVWDDKVLETAEALFITKLGKALSLPSHTTQECLAFVDTFIREHRSEIAYLNYSNPVMHFYNQTSRTVSTLVLRNKKRLLKELSQSRELVVLLGQSTLRDLEEEEKALVKRQLIDICKSVPSLAIFILPGGGLLLPLLMKFIPQLLPSAFNENQEH